MSGTFHLGVPETTVPDVAPMTSGLTVMGQVASSFSKHWPAGWLPARSRPGPRIHMCAIHRRLTKG